MFRQDSQLGAGRSSEHASKATTSVEPTLAQAKGLLFVSYLLLASSHTVALDAVSMQLKWKHQFQFAGYNQALEQGLYRDAGLDVPFGRAARISEAIAHGDANFGGRQLQRAAGLGSGPPAGSSGGDLPAFRSRGPASDRHQAHGVSARTDADGYAS